MSGRGHPKRCVMRGWIANGIVLFENFARAIPGSAKQRIGKNVIFPILVYSLNASQMRQTYQNTNFTWPMLGTVLSVRGEASLDIRQGSLDRFGDFPSQSLHLFLFFPFYHNARQRFRPR